MAGIKHGKVQVKRPNDAKARTIPATLWNLPDSPFKKQGYVIVADVKPVGVPEKPAAKPGKPAKAVPPVEADDTDGQPETNVEEG